MSRRILQSRAGRSLALVALASYAVVGVLGYGLHSVSHCEHALAAAHDCGDAAGHSHSHSSEHGGSSDSGPTVAASCDDCSICSFLAQAQSSAAPRLTIDGVEPLAVAQVQAAPAVLVVFGDVPQARGPPLS